MERGKYYFRCNNHFAKPEFHDYLIHSPCSHDGVIYQNELELKSQVFPFRIEGHKSRNME